MLKARNKKVSLILVIAMLMTMFVGLGTVSAASTYSVLSAPTLTANAAGQDLGIIQVDLPSCAAVKAGDVLTLSLPSEVKMAAAGAAVLTAAAAPAGVAANATKVEVYIPASLDGTVGGPANGLTPAAAGATAVVTATQTSLDITFGAAGNVNAGRLFIYVYAASIGSVEGDVTARLLAPANSAFTMGSAVVGKATSASGSTVSSILSVKTFGSAGGACDIISIAETTPNTLKAGEVIKVKLPNGYSWAAAGAGTQSWGWAGAAPTVLRDAADSRILNVTVNGAAFPSVVGGLSGRVNFAAPIVVDDSVAKTGDITARIYSANGAVTETDLVIAKYGTYGVTAEAGTAKDITAGKHDQKIGNFFIKEDLAGSLIGGRQIKMTLPTGVKWSGTYSTLMPVQPLATTGNLTIGAYGIADSNTTLRTTVGVVAGATKSKFEFKDLRVDVSPDFKGPITLTISGDAGATGEVVVANVTPAVEISAETIKDVKIGEQNQELGTVVIKESAKENIALTSAIIDTWDSAVNIPAAAGNITLTLPGGAEWSAGFPTVEVTEGDLQLKTSAMTKVGAVLTIPVKSASTTPSTIKVSNMKATLYRTVPEGPFEIAVAGTAINETGGAGYAFTQYEDISAAVAKCVTPAPAEGTSGSATAQFKISSNIYEVNGVAKVMDAAPYIKDSRTYVPIRYLGYALGVADKDVVWDATAQTATLSLGDTKVVFTIGSTTYTVNGESKTMDVAPEISNGRTMLPARYVAEALGYQVGWDASTGTVLVSK